MNIKILSIIMMYECIIFRNWVIRSGSLGLLFTNYALNISNVSMGWNNGKQTSA